MAWRLLEELHQKSSEKGVEMQVRLHQGLEIPVLTRMCTVRDVDVIEDKQTTIPEL